MADNNSGFFTPVSSEGELTPSLFVSPPESEGGLPAEIVNLRPQLNESLMGKQRAEGFTYPPGIAEPYSSRNTLESRQWGDPPFFINAKPTSMLERGWIRSMMVLTGEKGLLTIKDGPEMLVKIIRGGHIDPETYRSVYTVKNLADPSIPPFNLPVDDRHEHWEFYIPVDAVPFIPRGGSKKTRSKKRKHRKTRVRRKA